jgi:hypothetical protein
MDVVVTKSLPDEYVSGFTTYFFLVSVRDNGENSEIDTIEGTFTTLDGLDGDSAPDPAMRQVNPSGQDTIFADNNVDFVLPETPLRDSQFQYDSSDLLLTPGFADEDSTQLKAQFFLFSAPTITKDNPTTFAHVVLENDASATALIKFDYLTDEGSRQATFGELMDTNGDFYFEFNASSVGSGAAVPESGVILFWVVASVSLGLVKACRRSRVVPGPPKSVA